MSFQSETAFSWKKFFVSLFFFNLGISLFFSLMQGIRVENPYADVSGYSTVASVYEQQQGSKIGDLTAIDENTGEISGSTQPLLYITQDEQGYYRFSLTDWFKGLMKSSSFWTKLFTLGAGLIVASLIALATGGPFARLIGSGLTLIIISVVFPIFNGAVDFVASTIGQDIPAAVFIYTAIYWGSFAGAVFSIIFGVKST